MVVQKQKILGWAVMVILGVLLLGSVPLLAAAADQAQQDSPATQSFEELASACSPETVDKAYPQVGDEEYITLYGERKEDRDAILKLCGILKKFASDGVEENSEPILDVIPIQFKNGQMLDLYPDTPGKLGISSGLVLNDPQAYKDYLTLEKLPPGLTMEQKSVRFGQPLHLTGVLIAAEASETVSVYWVPLRDRYSSSDPNLSLLLYQGTAKFGRYDLTFDMPAYGTAADGTIKPLPDGDGRLIVSYAPYSPHDGSMSLEPLPAKDIFLSINGLPASDPMFKPLVEKGHTYVPLRAIGKLAGEPVVWDAKMHAVLIRTDPKAVGEVSKNAELWIDGKPAAAALQPIVRNGTAYVPIVAVQAAFALPVEWNGMGRTVNVTVPHRAES